MERPKSRELPDDHIAEVIYFTDLAERSLKRSHDPEQRQYWHNEAALSAVRIEDLQAELEEAEARRVYCLQMLGMLSGAQE